MIPKLLEYNTEDGRITITENAYLISEIKALIDKYDNPEPYLAYIHLMTAPDSPFINLSENQKEASIIYEITQSLGEFDITDELLEQAVDKFNLFYVSKAKNYYDSLGMLMDKVAKYAKDAEISDENLTEVNKMLRDAGATLRSYKEVEKQVDEEMKTTMRGKSTLGEY